MSVAGPTQDSRRSVTGKSQVSHRTITGQSQVNPVLTRLHAGRLQADDARRHALTREPGARALPRAPRHQRGREQVVLE